MQDTTMVLLILVGTLALFIWGYWRYDVVACLSLIACLLAGVVPYSSAFNGFSNPAVITVACVMVITHAINRSGIIDYVVKNITPVTTSPVLHIAVLSILAAFLSAFMNNVGALALLMPVAIQTAWSSKRSPSLVLMPLALGSALGGLTTSIGTPPNLLISSYRQQVTGYAYDMFDFSPVGIILAVVGLLFIVLVGWRLIPIRRKSAEATEDMFRIQDYITEVRVTEKSEIVGEPIKTIEQEYEGVLILGIIRNKRKKLSFRSTEKIQESDIFIVESTHENLDKLVNKFKLELVGEAHITEEIRSDEISVIEAVVPPGSRLEGRSARSMQLRKHHRINLLALSRKGTPFKQRLSRVTFRGGDIALLQGEAETLRESSVSLGFLPLVERGVQVGLQRRVIFPILIFGIAIVFAALRIFPVQIAFSGAVIAMVVTNVLPARRLYESIDWSIIVLLGAMIPVGGALQSSGGTELIAHAFVHLTGSMAPVFILGLLMIITMTLSDIMNNAATAVVMAPIGVGIAQAMGVSIDPFLMTVAVGASCSFLTPIGHQNNILVMGPGGYKFYDYFRIGVVLELIILIVGLPAILYFWPI